MHAKLSASGAKRWMACPPSVELEEKFPDHTTEFAAEGTLAHSLAELLLRYENQEISEERFNEKFNKLKSDPLYNQEMLDYIEDYTTLVWEQFHELRGRCKDTQILFEQRLDFSEYVPEGFGTGDVILIADDCVEVIDLKYGKGVAVSAVENPQLRLYGLGAYLTYSMLYEIDRVKMMIVQPRLSSISDEELEVSELLQWAEEEVRPKAQLAIRGAGEFQPGEHCRFCKAYAVCNAQKEYQMELLKYDFVSAELLQESEIGEVLCRVDALINWGQAIKDYAYNQAINYGVHYEGWKLVAGRSNRKYKDEKEVAATLQKAGYTEIYKPQELKGITEMEKLIGKKTFAKLLENLIEKPEGKPALVPETDKRPALDNVQTIKNEFEGD